MTAEQFESAVERLADYCGRAYGREPAEDVGAFLAAFNDVFIEMLTRRRDGTYGYATAGRSGSRKPRTFDLEEHFRSWFHGCVRNRRTKAKARYDKRRQDHLDPTQPDDNLVETTRAHAKKSTERSKLVVCPHCAGRDDSGVNGLHQDWGPRLAAPEATWQSPDGLVRGAVGSNPVGREARRREPRDARRRVRPDAAPRPAEHLLLVRSGVRGRIRRPAART